MELQEPKERRPGISGRELGVAIPISFGTAMAFESAMGLLPDKQTSQPEINNYDAVWVNVRTLFRNMLSAMETESRKMVLPEDVTEALINEMTVIQSAVSDVTRGLVQVVFYVCTHSSITRKYPNGSYRNSNDNSDNQKTSYIVEQQAIRGVLDSGAMVDIRKFDLEFGDNQSVMIVTHQAVDLLNRYKFKKIVLLETHTGSIKPPSRWYTKLQNGKELVNIPFDRMTLQLFGDGSMFSPMNLKVRKHLVELAKKNGWTYMTTRDLIMKTIRDTRDPLFEAYIAKLY